MEIIATVTSLRTEVKGYGLQEVLAKVHEIMPDRIFVTEEMKRSPVEVELYNNLAKNFHHTLSDCSIDSAKYEEFRSEFLRINTGTPENSVKKNMLELVDETIFNYLANYWKNFESVNSEVTDSLFRAKHQLISGVFYDLEKGFWISQNQEILNKILNEKLTEKSVIISGVERRYWLSDQLKKQFPQI